MNSRLLGALGVSMLICSAHAQRVDTVLSTNLSEPRGIASDGSAMYIADSGNNCIFKYTKEGVLSVMAGKSGPGGVGTNNGLGIRAQFNGPQGIVYSKARNGLVVADYGNSDIRLVDTISREVTTIGGQGRDGSDDGDQFHSTYSYPAAVDIDLSTEEIYVADYGNGLIRVLDLGNRTSTYFDLNAASSTGSAAPSSIAIGTPGTLWVGDSLNKVIWFIAPNLQGKLEAKVMAGQVGNSGTNDADFATEGRLSTPWGLLWRGWRGSDADLIISDSSSHTLRRLYFNTSPDVWDWSLTTFSGSPRVAGAADALVPAATFCKPMGLSPMGNSSFYIADSGNSRIRLFTENTSPIKAVSDPKIGYITISVDPQTGIATPVFNDLTGTTKTFDNAQKIVFTQAENVGVRFKIGDAPASSFPDPTSADFTWTQLYGSGLSVDQLPPTVLGEPSSPDKIIKVIAEKDDGSPPSAMVKAEIKFRTGSPIISGKNAASLSITCPTANAKMYYEVAVTDPPEPTTASTPVPSGTFSIPIKENTFLKVKAFKDNYYPSDPATIELLLSDFSANRLVWGFDSGEGSTGTYDPDTLHASAGQVYYAPVGLMLMPGKDVYSFQFDSWITRANTAPAITLDFSSLLLEKLTVSYRNIIPNLRHDAVLSAQGGGTTYSLSIGWQASYPESILYKTSLQDLMTYAMCHEVVYGDKDNVILGAVRVPIPLDAPAGETYQLQLANGSGADREHAPLTMQVITDGSLGGGTVNTIKKLNVGATSKYLVGSIWPFRWYNAGDFGTNTLGNADVIQVFDAALYLWPIYQGTNVPPDSDVFDAMDSATSDLNVTWSNLPQDDFNSINAMALGDRALDLNDIYVTFRRSTDPSLKWYNRYWLNGQRTPEETANLLVKPELRARAPMPTQAATQTVDSGPHALRVRGSDYQAVSGQTLEIPITVEVTGDAPVRTMLISADVVALDGSPEITNAIGFWETDDLATTSRLTKSVRPNNFGGAWLDSQVTGVVGTNILGTFTVPVPPNANSKSAYLVHFRRFSASPNGLRMFPTTTEDSLITLADRSTSSWNDGIPDSWRLRYFGTVSNLLSSATADADGDGVSNNDEYLAGTNPVDAMSKPEIKQPTRPTLGLVGISSDPVPTFTLQWASESGRQYSVEAALDLFGTNWVNISTNISGDGGVVKFSDTNATGKTRFYRVRAQ